VKEEVMSIIMIPSSACLPWQEMRKVDHYRLEVDALAKPAGAGDRTVFIW
jgi:hypothetical protein